MIKQGLGSGENGQLTFLDIISIVSFLIGVENLELNATQDDMQRIQRELSDKSEQLLKEIHGHLEEQDKKLEKIMEVISNENNQETL